MRLFVGNLPFKASDVEVRALFEQFGSVDSVTLINDRDTGRPRGFGFVEMSSENAETAMKALDGQDFMGRPLRVNEAQERAASPRPAGRY